MHSYDNAIRSELPQLTEAVLFDILKDYNNALPHV